MRAKYLLLGVLLALGVATAGAQTSGTITFTTSVTTGNGSVTPVLTWSTSPAAESCLASGGWTGVKTGGGTESLAAISKSTTYNLTCTWAAKNFVKLTWTPPLLNEDTSALTDLKGYKVYYGSSSVLLDKSIDVPNAGASTATVQALSVGPWYFQVTAYNGANVESKVAPVPPLLVTLTSAQGTKSVGINVNPVPMPPTNVTAE